MDICWNLVSVIYKTQLLLDGSRQTYKYKWRWRDDVVLMTRWSRTMIIKRRTGDAERRRSVGDLLPWMWGLFILSPCSWQPTVLDMNPIRSDSFQAAPLIERVQLTHLFPESFSARHPGRALIAASVSPPLTWFECPEYWVYTQPICLCTSVYLCVLVCVLMRRSFSWAGI